MLQTVASSTKRDQVAEQSSSPICFGPSNGGSVGLSKNRSFDTANCPVRALDVGARHILHDRALLELAFGAISPSAFSWSIQKFSQLAAKKYPADLLCTV